MPRRDRARVRMSGILAPIADSDSETDSDACTETGTLTDTVSEAGSIADIAACNRPSALRLRVLLPCDESRRTQTTAAPTAELPRCQARIHPSHQSEAGIRLLEAALIDLDQELVRAGTHCQAARYPRAVPRCPMDASWHFRFLVRQVEQHLALLGRGEVE